MLGRVCQNHILSVMGDDNNLLSYTLLPYPVQYMVRSHGVGCRSNLQSDEESLLPVNSREMSTTLITGEKRSG
jgi:hypothetical protein